MEEDELSEGNKNNERENVFTMDELCSFRLFTSHYEDCASQCEEQQQQHQSVKDTNYNNNNNNKDAHSVCYIYIYFITHHYSQLDLIQRKLRSFQQHKIITYLHQLQRILLLQRSISSILRIFIVQCRLTNLTLITYTITTQ